MARIWKEPYDPTKHQNHMLKLGGISQKHRQAPSLIPADIIFVSVCSFTFEFHNLEQLTACLTFYSSKIHDSSRANVSGMDHWEAQRWYEQLPLYLQEEPKRVKVVAALKKALEKFSPLSADAHPKFR